MSMLKAVLGPIGHFVRVSLPRAGASLLQFGHLLTQPLVLGLKLRDSPPRVSRRLSP